MGEEKISQMLGQDIEVQLGDGKNYKLGQLSILDLMYFEEKFGSINILYSSEKQFTVILHILYCVLRKNHPNLKFEDLDKLLPIKFLNEHPEIVEIITKQVMGSLNQETKDSNPPQPATVQ